MPPTSCLASLQTSPATSPRGQRAGSRRSSRGSISAHVIAAEHAAAAHANVKASDERDPNEHPANSHAATLAAQAAALVAKADAADAAAAEARSENAVRVVQEVLGVVHQHQQRLASPQRLITQRPVATSHCSTDSRPSVGSAGHPASSREQGAHQQTSRPSNSRERGDRQAAAESDALEKRRELETLGRASPRAVADEYVEQRVAVWRPSSGHIARGVDQVAVWRPAQDLKQEMLIASRAAVMRRGGLERTRGGPEAVRGEGLAVMSRDSGARSRGSGSYSASSLRVRVARGERAPVGGGGMVSLKASTSMPRYPTRAVVASQRAVGSPYETAGGGGAIGAGAIGAGAIGAGAGFKGGTKRAGVGGGGSGGAGGGAGAAIFNHGIIPFDGLMAYDLERPVDNSRWARRAPRPPLLSYPYTAVYATTDSTLQGVERTLTVKQAP